MVRVLISDLVAHSVAGSANIPLTTLAVGFHSQSVPRYAGGHSQLGQNLKSLQQLADCQKMGSI